MSFVLTLHELKLAFLSRLLLLLRDHRLHVTGTLLFIGSLLLVHLPILLLLHLGF